MWEFIDKKFSEICLLIVAFLIAFTIIYAINRLSSDYPWGWVKVDNEDCLDLRESFSIPFSYRKIYCEQNGIYQLGDGSLHTER